MRRRILIGPAYDVDALVLTGLVFREFPLFADMVAEVTAAHQVNDQVQVVTVLECVVHVHQEANTKGNTSISYVIAKSSKTANVYGTKALTGD